MSSGHMCSVCAKAMAFDFDGAPYCGNCNGVGARILAALRALFAPSEVERKAPQAARSRPSA